MNLKAVYRLANVLTLSQLRGYQRSKHVARIFGDPRIIIVVDSVLLLALGLVGYVIVSMSAAAFLRETVRAIEAEALAGVPTAIAFSVIVFGVLYEISQSLPSLTTDLVNWLPISPSEYVAGSTISEAYLYSFMLCLILGVLLGPALFFGAIHLWMASAAMALIALLIGACVVEVLDALTNRISSSFYRKSGRSGIVFRLIVTIIVLVFVQLLFSGQIIMYLLPSMIQTVQTVWFVPVLWPSVAVLGVSQGNAFNFSIFAILSLGFMLGLFGLAVFFRDRFWVPVPVSIKLTRRAYRPTETRFELPGFGLVESAIFRKDLRSLTRRREMARFLAIPFVLAASIGFSALPLGGTSTPEAPGFLATIPLYVIPVTIFAGILAMTSIGQEGYAIWNLYAAPIKARHLLRAKVFFVVLLGILFSLGFAGVLALLLKPIRTYFWILIALGISVVLEQSAIGIYIGARFPDFRETVRSRFVGVWGSIFGILLGLFIAFFTASPIFVSVMIYHSVTSQLAAVVFILGVAVFLAATKIAQRQLELLLQSIRV